MIAAGERYCKTVCASSATGAADSVCKLALEGIADKTVEALSGIVSCMDPDAGQTPEAQRIVVKPEHPSLKSLAVEDVAQSCHVLLHIASNQCLAGGAEVVLASRGSYCRGKGGGGLFATWHTQPLPWWAGSPRRGTPSPWPRDGHGAGAPDARGLLPLRPLPAMRAVGNG